jgi:transposase
LGLSMAQYEDIKQKINQGLTDRQIAKAVGRRRSTISEIRKGLFKFEDQQKFPEWMNLVSWDEVLKDIGLKHPMSLIWEESASKLTSYSNFTRYLHKKFPHLKIEEYSHRHFNPGERVEVDWAGDVIEWIDPKNAKINRAYIFVGCLGYSQLIFAKAFSSMKEIDFLSAHESMFNFYGGVTEVICPDNTKTAVIKSNKYDPDLNEEYNRFTKHYGVTVAPARVYSPKDKALVEGAVKLVQRYFRWRNRKNTFTSLNSVNKALREICETINTKVHTRFRVSRRDRFNFEEAQKLKPLPAIKYELCETKFCKVHPDGTICVNYRYYSVPYLLVGESVFVKLYANTVEIYHKLEKIAVHLRLTKYPGEKSILSEHIPDSAQAYKNTTVQFVIQQSLFIDPIFKEFIEGLLLESPCGHLRKAQGFVREARAIKGKVEAEVFKKILTSSICDLQRYNQVRVENFKRYLQQHLKENLEVSIGDQIKRGQDNPMLRKNQTLH